MVLCKHLEGKTLITAILRLNVVTHHEMLETLVQEVEDAPETKEEFREQRRRKRNSSDGQATQAENPALAKPTQVQMEGRTSAA
jgi:hypothetical protein